MNEITIIRHFAQVVDDRGFDPIVLTASRATLAKRRWRGVSVDGREFGFDLDKPLRHGALVHVEGDRRYYLEQEPEDVLEIPVTSLEQAARIAWGLGNLHFGLQVLAAALRVPDDPAVLRLLEREEIVYVRINCIFLPLSGGASHHHEHAHE